MAELNRFEWAYGARRRE